MTYIPRGARQLILAAHLGRPKDHEPELSLKPAAERLSELLGVDVALAPSLDELPDAEVVMLENVRYDPGETKNDPGLIAGVALDGVATAAREVLADDLTRQIRASLGRD